MKRSLRAFVRARAGDRCEYCRIHQKLDPHTPFHVEHIIAKKHHGDDSQANLAWSCHACNAGKSSNLSGLDLQTRRVTVLFHPRRQRWSRHFKWDGAKLKGRTPCGRVTIDVLNINDVERVEIRAYLILAGEFPPDEDRGSP